tara:strand:- start:421 stop:606 length:186 start_codon:yes stop_codon:yes gene_type:complete
MLTKVLLNRQVGVSKSLFACTQQMGFRDNFKNPYRNVAIPVSQAMREEQAEKPVWDRVFDH